MRTDRSPVVFSPMPRRAVRIGLAIVPLGVALLGVAPYGLVVLYPHFGTPTDEVLWPMTAFSVPYALAHLAVSASRARPGMPSPTRPFGRSRS